MINSFFYNDTATTEIYTLSLHDALPISSFTERSSSENCASLLLSISTLALCMRRERSSGAFSTERSACASRSEEHTSELQSRQYLVCRLLLEKKTDHHLHNLNAS